MGGRVDTRTMSKPDGQLLHFEMGAAFIHSVRVTIRQRAMSIDVAIPSRSSHLIPLPLAFCPRPRQCDLDDNPAYRIAVSHNLKRCVKTDVRRQQAAVCSRHEAVMRVMQAEFLLTLLT